MHKSGTKPYVDPELLYERWVLNISSNSKDIEPIELVQMLAHSTKPNLYRLLNGSRNTGKRNKSQKRKAMQTKKKFPDISP